MAHDPSSIIILRNISLPTFKEHLKLQIVMKIVASPVSLLVL